MSAAFVISKDSNMWTDILMQYKPAVVDFFESNDRELWHVFGMGMGCSLYAKQDGRRHNVHTERQPIYVFFMHSDSWGQYGTSDVPKLAQFIPSYYEAAEDLKETNEFLNQYRHSRDSQRQMPNRQGDIIHQTRSVTQSLYK